MRARARARVRTKDRVRNRVRVRVRVRIGAVGGGHREHHDTDGTEHLGHTDSRLVVHAIGHVPFDGVEPAVPG